MMKSFCYYLYNLVGIPLLRVGFFLGTLFNSKIRQGIKGRKYLFKQLEEKIPQLLTQGPRFWIHNSSMGEFEQAKPLIERLKQRFPGGSVIVSFFSPSGFEHVRGYEKADHLCYLPFDSRGNAKRFLSLVKPDVAIVIRHDIWPNHLWELRRRKIPTVLINCSIRRGSCYRSLPILLASRFLYSCFDLILTVSKETQNMCEMLALGKGQVEVVGDTRYDQVVRRAREAEKIIAPLRRLKGKRKGFVMGSTWPSDEEVLFEALERLYKKEMEVWGVLVPHEPLEERLVQIEQQLSLLGLRSYRFSDVVSGKSTGDGDVLIVDKVGILASLYALGEVSFVGGGFGPGIHNVLEPAALGKVVLFGPRCKNSYEAGQLEKMGVGFVVRNGKELYEILYSFLKNSRSITETGKIAEDLVRENMGATDRIVDHLEQMVC